MTQAISQNNDASQQNRQRLTVCQNLKETPAWYTSSLISIEKFLELVDRISCRSDTNQLWFQSSPVSLDLFAVLQNAGSQNAATDVSNKEVRLPMTTGLFHGIQTLKLRLTDLCKFGPDAVITCTNYSSHKYAEAATRLADRICFISNLVKGALGVCAVDNFVAKAVPGLLARTTDNPGARSCSASWQLRSVMNK